MNTLNPNKYIRQAYIQALSVATGLNVWHKKVPKTVNPIPKQYLLLDSQTKNETVKAKLDYFEWLATLDLQIYNYNPKGFTDTEKVDNIEEIVIETIRVNGISIPNFSNKNVDILDSIDLDLETDTNSIDRRIIKFEHWLYGR